MAASDSAVGPRLAGLLAPVVEEAGLDLEDVQVVAAGKRRVVRVLVDKDGGVSLDDIATASHAISAVLDDQPAAGALLGNAAYVLEVSSPGVDRPLVEPRHWRRAHGRLVRVALASGGDLTGRVVAADDAGVRLAVEDSGDERTLRFDELGPGRVQVEFNRQGDRLEADRPASVSHLPAEESR